MSTSNCLTCFLNNCPVLKIPRPFQIGGDNIILDDFGLRNHNHLEVFTIKPYPKTLLLTIFSNFSNSLTCLPPQLNQPSIIGTQVCAVLLLCFFPGFRCNFSKGIHGAFPLSRGDLDEINFVPGSEDTGGEG